MNENFFSGILVFCSALCDNGNAQPNPFFFELLGPGFVFINYVMRFQKTEGGLGGRVGVWGFSVGRPGKNRPLYFCPCYQLHSR